MFTGRAVRTTERGTRCAILQDAPNSIHVTLQKGNNLIYQGYTDLSNEEQLNDNIRILEDEFLAPLPQLGAPDVSTEEPT